MVEQRQIDLSTEFVKGFYEKVNRTSIDFFALHHLPMRKTRKIMTSSGARSIRSLVDVLYVDTEGQDPLILKGSLRLIRNGDIRVVVFEYDQVIKIRKFSFYFFLILFLYS